MLRKQKLVLMRGIPGSGKSTLARDIAFSHLYKGGRSVATCSTDDYHIENGVYVFKRDMLGSFHVRNQIRAFDFMNNGVELVIVDNTNIKRKAMEPYIDSAIQCKYKVEEIIVGREQLFPNMDAGAHEFDEYIQLCAERNTHGVPKDAIEKMARSFQE